MTFRALTRQSGESSFNLQTVRFTVKWEAVNRENSSERGSASYKMKIKLERFVRAEDIHSLSVCIGALLTVLCKNLEWPLISLSLYKRSLAFYLTTFKLILRNNSPSFLRTACSLSSVLTLESRRFKPCGSVPPRGTMDLLMILYLITRCENGCASQSGWPRTFTDKVCPCKTSETTLKPQH